MPQPPVKVRSIQYALTVTLKPRWYVLEPSKQFSLLQNEIENIFCKDETFTITMKAEYTNTYNIHAHGFIEMLMPNAKTNPKLKIANLLRTSKIIGFFCLKPVTDYHKWLDYINKSTEVKDTIGHDIIVDTYDIFGIKNKLEDLLSDCTSALKECGSELTNDCCF